MTDIEMRTYDFLVESGVATAEELNLARNLVSGTWTEVLNAVLFIRTGYRSLEQWITEEMEDFED